MKNKYFSALILLLLLISCKISQRSSALSEGNNDNEFVGHLKFGLIEYEIVDTSIISKRVAEMMIAHIQSSVETELIFNHSKSAELVKMQNSTDYFRRFLYDRSENLIYQFLTKDSKIFYSKMNFDNISFKGASQEEIILLEELIKVIKYPESKTEIFGFKCDEVFIMQPDDLSKVYAIGYTTSEIPYASEAMGDMSNYFTGVPLKTILFVNGLKITVGAIEYSENVLFKKFLDFNPKDFKEVTPEKFEEMKNN